jgi:phage protein D
MIAKSNNPLSPDTVITIHGVEVDYTSVVGFTLTLEEGKHDVCAIRVRGLHPKAITDYIDAPVRVSLSSGPGRRQEFCGYIMYVEPTSITKAGFINQSPFQEANLVCFGVSMLMKETVSRVWNNLSVTAIAQFIADKYSFSIDVKKSTYTFPRIVQAVESDWAFLNRVAEMYGMRMSVHGTHMHLWDPADSVGRRPSFMRLLSTRKNLDAVPGTITKFNGSFGYVTPDGAGATYQVASIDSTGKITTTSNGVMVESTLSGQPRLTKFNHLVSETPQNIAEAELQIKSQTLKQFAFNATIEIIAGAGVVPGGIVFLDEYNSNFDGIWYVKSVQHEHMGSNYYTTLSVGRDYNATNTFDLPNVEIADLPPDPVFVNNKWQSSDKRVISYV